MKKLPKEFIGKGEIKGFEFRLLSKKPNAFLYQVNTGNQIHYEVFKRIENKRFGCISNPTSKAFGIWAWSSSNLVQAIKKFNELI